MRIAHNLRLFFIGALLSAPLCNGNYYDDLKVPTNATADQIRDSYRYLAVNIKRYMNKNPSSSKAQARFKAVTEAYDTLKDEDKRRAYDEQESITRSSAPSSMQSVQSRGRSAGQAGVVVRGRRTHSRLSHQGKYHRHNFHQQSWYLARLRADRAKWHRRGYRHHRRA